MTDNQVAQNAQTAAEALLKLGDARPELASNLSRLVVAVANEAGRTPRFANTLQEALSPGTEAATRPKRSGRRDPGIIDPFSVYSEAGEAGLRERLAKLNLEQLRDIVAEHGMDHDRLAMKWKDPNRVIDRIIDKVRSRATKGSAFRPSQG